MVERGRFGILLMELLGGLWELCGVPHCHVAPGSARSLPLIFQISKLQKHSSDFQQHGQIKREVVLKPLIQKKKKQIFKS